MNPDREAALHEVVGLIRRHGLTLDDLRAALEPGNEPQAPQAANLLPRVFAYVGGTFVFIGLVTFVSMRWYALDAFGRVLLTLGSGFCLFLSALFCCFDARATRAATPLLLVAAVLQPTGILVALEEYGRGGDPVLGLMFMHALMFIQQGAAFVRLQRTALAFTTLVFGTGFMVLAMDRVGVPPRLLGMTLGLSLVCIGLAAARSRHEVLAPWAWFFGSVSFLMLSYDWLDGSAADGLFAGLAAGTVYLSTVARSRTLLAVGTLALCGWLGDFMWEHFRDSLSAPLVLIVLGFMLIALGILAVKIHKRYIGPQAAG